jgi:CSLREA domain-containing protein
MNAQNIGPMMHKKTALVVVVASVLLSLAMLITPRPAHASTTFTVNALSDNEDASDGDNLCDINTVLLGDQCTLRAAIQQANRTPGVDTINFDIPDSFGTGVKTIHVGDITGTELPPITEAVTIDGYTQPGSSPNTLAKGTNAKLMIQLEGSAAPNYGLDISSPGEVVVKGLVINRFKFNVYGDDATNTRIEGNFIGTAPSGTEARSIANCYYGVYFYEGSGSSGNVVGGPDPAARNLISGNGGYGVGFSSSNGNYVYGNLIGTQRDGKSPLGNKNSGIVSYFSNYNQLGGAPGNTIAFNGDDGVRINSGVGNAIVSNSIFSNGGLGINLVGGTESASGATANDPGDTDTGANDLQNKPVLSSAKKSASGKTIIKGTLNSGSNKDYLLQFFSNPSGADEGKKLLFSKTVTTDGSGNASFAFATTKQVKLGQNITATATKGSTGDTSEFSAPRKVVAS